MTNLFMCSECYEVYKNEEGRVCCEEEVVFIGWYEEAS